MAGKMERHYFEEKKELAIEGVQHANQTAGEVLGLLSSWSYEVPNIIDPASVHEQIRAAKAQLDGVRRNLCDGHPLKQAWSSMNGLFSMDIKIW